MASASPTPSIPSFYAPNPSSVPTSRPSQSAKSPLSTTPYTTFPPFYTLQPNQTTRTAQLQAWSSLLQFHCQHQRPQQWRLIPTDPVFHHEAINRRFSPEDVAVLFAFMREKGAALPVTDTSSLSSTSRGGRWLGGSSSTPQPSTSDGLERLHGDVYILPRTLESYTSQLLEWVEETGQRGAVLTVFEMTEGEQSRGKAWEGMPGAVFRRVLEGCVKRQRGALMGEVDGVGIKFF